MAIKTVEIKRSSSNLERQAVGNFIEAAKKHTSLADMQKEVDAILIPKKKKQKKWYATELEITNDKNPMLHLWHLDKKGREDRMVILAYED